MRAAAVVALGVWLAPLAGSAETLDELLASRALESAPHPIAAEFLAGEGAMMNTPSMQRMQESARGSMAGGLMRSAVGIGGVGADVDPEQVSREIEQAMAEPWVRGIGAARALAALGDAEAAARFYVACLQTLDEQWAPTACLTDIIALGPRRAAKRT
jgi:hypothetical protein